MFTSSPGEAHLRMHRFGTNQRLLRHPRGRAQAADGGEERSAEASLLRFSRNHIGSANPESWRIPARSTKYSIAESAPCHFWLNLPVTTAAHSQVAPLRCSQSAERDHRSTRAATCRSQSSPTRRDCTREPPATSLRSALRDLMGPNCGKVSMCPRVTGH